MLAVESITAGTINVAQGNKRGTATVVADDLGNPVAGAIVTGDAITREVLPDGTIGDRLLVRKTGFQLLSDMLAALGFRDLWAARNGTPGYTSDLTKKGVIEGIAQPAADDPTLCEPCDVPVGRRLVRLLSCRSALGGTNFSFGDYRLWRCGMSACTVDGHLANEGCDADSDSQRLLQSPNSARELRESGERRRRNGGMRNAMTSSDTHPGPACSAARVAMILALSTVMFTSCSATTIPTTSGSSAPSNVITTVSDNDSTVTVASSTTTSSTTRRPTTTTGPERGSTLPPDARIEVGATERSVSALGAEVGCREDAARSSFAALAWTPAESIGEEQRVAVTIFAGSLLDVPFEVSPPLAPSISAYEWVRVSGQAEHTWTVLTLRDGVWYAGPLAYFTGPTCVSDEQP